MHTRPSVLAEMRLQHLLVSAHPFNTVTQLFYLRVRRLRSSNSHGVDRVGVAIRRQGRLLHRCTFCAGVPQHNLTRVRASNDDVTIERVEAGARNL